MGSLYRGMKYLKMPLYFNLWLRLPPLQCIPRTGLAYQQLWQDFDKAKQNLLPIEFIWRGKNITRVT